METICDRCGMSVELEETATPDGGEWDGATLCPDCYAEAGTEGENGDD